MGGKMESKIEFSLESFGYDYIRGTEIRNFPKNLDPHFSNSIPQRRPKNPPGRNSTNFYSLEIF
jgi:hypothetical protein